MRWAKTALIRINGKPALDLYDYYFSGLTPSPEYPLAIFEEDSDSFYLRAPVGCDRATGQIQFLVDIPAQVEAQIAHASQADILTLAKPPPARPWSATLAISPPLR
jgi:hypothetical protein